MDDMRATVGALTIAGRMEIGEAEHVAEMVLSTSQGAVLLYGQLKHINNGSVPPSVHL